MKNACTPPASTASAAERAKSRQLVKLFDVGMPERPAFDVGMPERPAFGLLGGAALRPREESPSAPGSVRTARR